MNVTNSVFTLAGTNSKSMFTPSASCVAMSSRHVSMAAARFVGLDKSCAISLLSKLVIVRMTFTPCACASATRSSVSAPPQPL